jgi:signal transduction histidine kinase
MESPDPAAKLRHDLANPLAAILAEAQLMLMDADQLDDDVRAGFRRIEESAMRMRMMLHESRGG